VGTDDAFADDLAEGRLLSIRSANDAVAFSLKGSRAALTSLRNCVARYGHGSAELTEIRTPTVPPALAALLAAAGFQEITPIDLSGLPDTQRVADFAWQSADIVGGVRERTAESGASLETLARDQMGAMAKLCGPDSRLESGTVTRSAKAAQMRATLECTRKDARVVDAMLFSLGVDDRFTAFYLEAPLESRQKAVQARDRIAQALTGVTKGESSIQATDAAKQRSSREGNILPKPE